MWHIPPSSGLTGLLNVWLIRHIVHWSFSLMQLMMQNTHCSYWQIHVTPPTPQAHTVCESFFRIIHENDYFEMCVSVCCLQCELSLYTLCVCVSCQTGSLAGGITAVGAEGVYCPFGEKTWACVYREGAAQQNRTEHTAENHTFWDMHAHHTHGHTKKAQRRKTEKHIIRRERERGNNQAEQS